MRQPAVAGSFYPADKEELVALVDGFIKNGCSKFPQLFIHPRIFVAPHAGYMYSGPVAGYTYCALKRMHTSYNRFIILAPAHTVYLEGIALDVNNKWHTPMGIVKADFVLVKELLNLAFAVQSGEAHVKEHAIEVQLPFLQYLYKNKFSFAPVVIGDLTIEKIHMLAKTLVDILQKYKDVAIIVSSDLSHYLPYDIAKVVDNNTIRLVEDCVNNGSLNMNCEFILPEQACGAMGINTVMLVARKLKYKAKLLQYLNSGDTAGDKAAVVGYASIVMGEDVAV